jgi:hypothetical protein
VKSAEFDPSLNGAEEVPFAELYAIFRNSAYAIVT